MLELTKRSERWQWMIHGKHPAVPEYVSAGRMFPVAAALAGWLDRGFSGLQLRTTPPEHRSAWRFWLRGGSPDEISCGIMTDSSDSLGRPYPLLIVGNGLLKGWERQWDLVPAACESTWVRMEHLATTRFGDLAALERDVVSLPLPGWDSFCRSGDDDLTGPELPALSGESSFNKLAEDMIIKKCGYILLDRVNDYGKLTRSASAGSAVKRHLKSAPTSVFIGGTAGSCWYVFFGRPLTDADFSTLWLRLPQRRAEDLP